MTCPVVGHLDQPREAEGAAGHVLHQTLDPRPVAGRQEHRLIDAEATVRPTPHVLDDFRLDLPFGQVQGEDGFLPGRVQPVHVELGHFQEVALPG